MRNLGESPHMLIVGYYGAMLWNKVGCYVNKTCIARGKVDPGLLAYFPTRSLNLQNPFWSIWGIKRLRKRLLRGLQKYLMVWSGRILGWEDGSPEIEIPPSNIHIPKHQHPYQKIPPAPPTSQPICWPKLSQMAVFFAVRATKVF